MLKFDKLTEGISYDGKTFDVSFFHNNDSDIIDVCVPFIHQTKFGHWTYLYGTVFDVMLSQNSVVILTEPEEHEQCMLDYIERCEKQ